MPEIKAAAEIHSQRHAADGPDPLTPADIGASPSGHSHSWDQITDKPANSPPSAHAASHATGGSDPITTSSIGALPALPNGVTGGAMPTAGGSYVGHADDMPLGSFYVSGAKLVDGWPVDQTHSMVICTGHNTYANRQQILVTMYYKVMWVRTQHPNGTWHSWTKVGPQTPEDIGAVASDDPRLLDTGWRLLSPENGWTGEIRLRRFGPMVHFRARALNGTASTSSNVIQIPSGFKPGPNLPAHGMGNKSSNAQSGSDPIGAVGGGNNDLVRTFGTTSSWTGGSASIEWMTSDAFPTALPGTPV